MFNQQNRRVFGNPAALSYQMPHMARQENLGVGLPEPPAPVNMGDFVGAQGPAYQVPINNQWVPTPGQSQAVANYGNITQAGQVNRPAPKQAAMMPQAPQAQPEQPQAQQQQPNQDLFGWLNGKPQAQGSGQGAGPPGSGLMSFLNSGAAGMFKERPMTPVPQDQWASVGASPDAKSVHFAPSSFIEDGSPIAQMLSMFSGRPG